MVIALVPSAACCAVSVNELLPAAGLAIDAGEKTAVTPAGNPVTVSASAPENPPDTDVLTGTTTLPVRATDAVVEVVVRLNPLTANVTITVGAGDTPPLVPVTVIANRPAATVLATLAVIVTYPPPLAMLAEENCTVTPGGIPLAESVTFEVSPVAVIVIVDVADVPGAAVMLAADALRANVTGDDTVSANVVVADKLPLVPFIVME
jgi:hypothetical protein